jgi:hypothetical protein
MSIRRIPLNEASPEQLLDYGQTVLGLPFAPHYKPETMIAKILEAKPGLDILEVEIDEDIGGEPLPAASEINAGPKPARASVPPGADPATDFVTVWIGASEGPGGDRDIPVGVNGQIMTVPRNKEVAIPRSYYEALINTDQTMYDVDRDGNIILPGKIVQRFNLRLMQEGIKAGVPVARVKAKKAA